MGKGGGEGRGGRGRTQHSRRVACVTEQHALATRPHEQHLLGSHAPALSCLQRLPCPQLRDSFRRVQPQLLRVTERISHSIHIQKQG